MSKLPTAKQFDFLEKNGIDCTTFTKSQASKAINKIIASERYNTLWNSYNMYKIDEFLDSFETDANLSHTIPNVV